MVRGDRLEIDDHRIFPAGDDVLVVHVVAVQEPYQSEQLTVSGVIALHLTCILAGAVFHEFLIGVAGFRQHVRHSHRKETLRPFASPHQSGEKLMDMQVTRLVYDFPSADGEHGHGSSTVVRVATVDGHIFQSEIIADACEGGELVAIHGYAVEHFLDEIDVMDCRLRDKTKQYRIFRIHMATVFVGGQQFEISPQLSLRIAVAQRTGLTRDMQFPYDGFQSDAQQTLDVCAQALFDKALVIHRQ